MLYTISNTRLTVQVDSCGGELMSILGADGIEYLWQGNPVYWKKRAPHLFPVVGRLTDGLCTLEGQRCAMDTHGFFRWREMALVEQGSGHLILSMKSDNETLAQYPRRWQFLLEYRLEGEKITQHIRVENLDERTMWFAYGGHPGFRVPLTEGLNFEDYEISFSKPCTPALVGISDACFVQGPDRPLELKEERMLPLKHSLFDRDALILKNMPHSVTLRSPRDSHAVMVEFPDMPYLGLWHAPRTDAPYLCIEPWTSLPSRQDVVEELSEQPDLIRLPPFGHWTTQWSITCMA